LWGRRISVHIRTFVGRIESINDLLTIPQLGLPTPERRPSGSERRLAVDGIACALFAAKKNRIRESYS
jgi:hypothetical protein